MTPADPKLHPVPDREAPAAPPNLIALGLPFKAPTVHRFTTTEHTWSAVAVRPNAGNWDLEVYTRARLDVCYYALAASSAQASGVDLVVGDFNNMSLATDIPVPSRVSGTTTAAGGRSTIQP